MKGRALIDTLRASRGPVALLREEFVLLADAVTLADEAAGDMIETECPREGEWWDTSRAINGLGFYNEVEEVDEINNSVSYLDRRGLIERKEGEPHLVRFVEVS